MYRNFLDKTILRGQTEAGGRGGEASAVQFVSVRVVLEENEPRRISGPDENKRERGVPGSEHLWSGPEDVPGRHGRQVASRSPR